MCHNKPTHGMGRELTVETTVGGRYRLGYEISNLDWLVWWGVSQIVPACRRALDCWKQIIDEGLGGVQNPEKTAPLTVRNYIVTVEESSTVMPHRMIGRNRPVPMNSANTIASSANGTVYACCQATAKPLQVHITGLSLSVTQLLCLLSVVWTFLWSVQVCGITDSVCTSVCTSVRTMTWAVPPHHSFDEAVSNSVCQVKAEVSTAAHSTADYSRVFRDRLESAIYFLLVCDFARQ